MASDGTGDLVPTGREGLVGARIGQYRIVREIGRGGMGVVYEAVHEGIGRRAAVKVLADGSGGAPPSAASLRRFLAEARALSRIEHPGVVRVFDFGDLDGGLPYLLMEYLDGERLRDRLDRISPPGSGRLPVAESLRIARQIGAAMAGAHRRGVVHRDLKPENVMLVADDEAPGGERVRLLDFGIAKLDRADGPRQTAEGMVMGTAAYMAPEQCVGDAGVDDRADVYALGVILYETLAGELPFSGDTISMMRQHVNREAPLLRTRAPMVGEGVEHLVALMMAREPSRRPRMGEVVQRLRDLERDASGSDSEVHPASMTAEAKAVDRERTSMGSTPPRQEAPPLQCAVPAGKVGEVAASEAARAETRLSPRSRRRKRWLLALLAIESVVVALVVARVGRRSPARSLAAMVHLPGGRFTMGSTDAEVAEECARQLHGCTESLRQRLAREQPAREIKLSPFYLDIDEVTNEQFATFLNLLGPLAVTVRDDSDEHYPRFVHERSTGLLLLDLSRVAGGIERAPDGKSFAARSPRARWPVAQVTWDGASQYCRALGKRLPTEAEWEYAARGTGRRLFPWGDAPPRCDGVVFGRGDSMG